MAPTSFRALYAAVGLLLLGWAQAHSWNEQLSLVEATNGDYTGAYGYPRGYVERTDSGFNDGMMTYLIPELSTGRNRINEADLLCHPSQRTTNQTQGFPRLQAAPGSVVAMKYLENGHVTLPQNQPGKPPNAGTVFVFGTSSPSQTEKIVDVMQWTYDGTGGDQRGRLLTAQNFDDGRCHQINSGTISTQRQQEFPDPPPPSSGSPTEQWCETDLKLPSSNDILKPGSLYTVYWVWQWPTAAGAPGLPIGKDEYYSTCSDLEIVAKEEDGPTSNTLVQQDPQTHAVTDYMSRTAITSLPDVSFYMQASWPVITSWENFLPPAASAVATASSYDVPSSAVQTSILTIASSSIITSYAASITATPTGASLGGNSVYVPGFSSIESNTMEYTAPSDSSQPASAIANPSPQSLTSPYTAVGSAGSVYEATGALSSPAYANTALATITLKIEALPGHTFYLVQDSTTLTYTMPSSASTASPNKLDRRIQREFLPPIDNSPMAKGTLRFSSSSSGVESMHCRTNANPHRSFWGRRERLRRESQHIPPQ